MEHRLVNATLPTLDYMLIQFLTYFFINSDPNLAQTQILTLKVTQNLTQTLILTLNKGNNKCAQEYLLFSLNSGPAPA